MADIAKFIEDIKALSVLELNELVKAIENEFGVSAAAVAVAGPAAGGAAAAPAEEKTEFDVVLKEIGASKLNVIKVVRANRSRTRGSEKHGGKRSFHNQRSSAQGACRTDGRKAQGSGSCCGAEISICLKAVVQRRLFCFERPCG